MSNLERIKTVFEERKHFYEIMSVISSVVKEDTGIQKSTKDLILVMEKTMRDSYMIASHEKHCHEWLETPVTDSERGY